MIKDNLLYLDNTVLSAFRRCPRYAQLRFEESLVGLAPAMPLTFGSAVHIGAASWLRGLPLEEALKLAFADFQPTLDPDEWRTPTKLQAVIEALYKGNPLKAARTPQGEPIVEMTASYPLPLNAELEYYLQLNHLQGAVYTGIIDAVVEAGAGIFHVCDHKTDSWDLRTPKGETPFLAPKIWNKFQFHRATRGYVWLCRKVLGELLPVQGSMINMIGVNERHVVLGRETFLHTSEQLAEWEANTVADITAFLKARAEAHWPQDEDRCHDWNRPCPFWDVCKAPATNRPELISVLFKKEEWNPLEVRKKNNE